MTAPPRSAQDPAFTDTRRFAVMRRIVGLANPFVRALLRRTSGGPLGRALLLLRFQGRTSGRWFETPVGYVRDGDDVVIVTSPTYRWWRNVVQDADVVVRIAGTWYAARGRVIRPEEPAYDDAVALHVRMRGRRMLEGFGLPLDVDGHVTAAGRATADTRARIVRLRLLGPTDAPPRP